MGLLVVMLALGGTVSLLVWSSDQPPGPAAPSAPRKVDTQSFPSFRVTLGAEEVVAGPVANYLDFPFFTMPTASGIIAYSSNTQTFAFSGASLDTLHLPTPDAPASHAVIGPGPHGSFDACGAWLASAYALTATHWIGWYHAEHDCNYTTGVTHTSMAFAESFDGGKTWQKTDYPHNQVVTPDAPRYKGDPAANRAGDAKVIRQGKYFYMLYYDGKSMYVARSLVSDQGRPGTWYKYYQGTYSQPGLGGHQTPVEAAASSLTWNTYLKAYLSIFISAKYGFYLKVSAGDDITRWNALGNDGTKSIYPLVSYPQDSRQDVWFGRTASSGEVYGYPSFIAPDGDSSYTGQVFYLYYMKLFAGTSFSQRYLMRRQMMLTLQSAPPFPALVDLARYQNPDTGVLRVFTEDVRPPEGDRLTAIVGALLPYPSPGFHPLYECSIPLFRDYLATDGSPSQDNWRGCGGRGTVFIRTIGWASDRQSSQTPIAIYRCFSSTRLNHFISTDPYCEGSTTEWLLGYIFSTP